MRTPLESILPTALALASFLPPAAARQTECHSWQPGFELPPDGAGLNSYVRELEVIGGELYAAGDFTQAGSTAVGHVARWDGTSWSDLGSGTNGSVWDVVEFDDGSGGGPALYVGGLFTSAGGSNATNVAKWDGQSWSPLGTGVNAHALCSAVYDDGSGPALYVGGKFTTAGGVSHRGIARWDGASWSSVGGGILGWVHALAVCDDGNGPALFAAGSFNKAGSISATNIARWDGTSWSALGSGANATVFALGSFDDGSGQGAQLVAGGQMTMTGGTATANIAAWNGGQWSALGSGLDSLVWDVASFDAGTGQPALYATGWFAASGPTEALRIARWDGQAWEAVGSGLSWNGLALASYGDELYVGGQFTQAGPHVSHRIARYARGASSTYCTAKTNSCGSLPAISGVGTPSASSTGGFEVRASNARAAKFGLLIYSDRGAAFPAIPFQGGFLCVKAPLKRTIPIVDVSGTPGQCDGLLSIDMNAFASGALGGSPLPSLLVPGTQINCQFWGRDAPGSSLLSDALHYAICP